MQQNKIVSEWEKPLPAGSYREVLRNPRFLQLWGAQFLAQVSQNAINFALIVLINAQTGSTLAGAVLVVLFSLPAIVMGPVPGLLVDRVGRWWVMWTVNLARMLLSLWGALELVLVYNGGQGKASTGLVALLYLFTIGLSIATRFYVPAESTAIPRVASLRGLSHGLALFGITFVVAQALGLIVLGPLLHTFFGWPAVFYVGTGGFAVATLLTLLLSPRRLGVYQDEPETLGAEAAELDPALLAGLVPESERQGLWQQLKAGWQAMVGDAQALTAVVRLSLAGVIIALVSAAAPNFVVQVLHRHSDEVSLVLAPAGIALIVGAVLAPRFTKKLGQLPTAALGVNGVALAVALLALNRPLGDFAHFSNDLIVALAVAEASLLGFALNLISIPCQAVIQERVQPGLRGQALAFQQALLNLAAAPVLLLVGVMADTVGLPWALLLVAVLVVLSTRWQLPVKQKHAPPVDGITPDVVTKTDTLIS